MTAADIYQQSLDKQRIVIVGEGSSLITSITLHTLSFYHRKFDYVLASQSNSVTKHAPLIVIQAINQLVDYKHHIVVLSDAGSSDSVAAFEQLTNATPKGGTILYPELNSSLKKIGAQERVDVQSISYGRYKNEVRDGKTFLISSTGDKFQIALGGEKNLEYISAAKELLKKIGIGSGQFYKAITSYPAI